MISRRGVAKKRREYKPGARTAKCSGAVATTQQSWHRSNHFQPLGKQRRFAETGRGTATCPYCPAMHNLHEIIWMIARCFAGAQDSMSTEHRRITCAGVCDSWAANPSFSGRRSRRQRHVTASDIKRVRLGIASFLCDVHFLRAFSSRDDTPASRSAQRNSFISDDRTIPCASCRMLCDRWKNAADTLKH